MSGSTELARAIENMEIARDSHLAWAEHLEAHAASGEPCPQCEARPYKLDVAAERAWVAIYEIVLRLLRSIPAAPPETEG